MIDSPQGHSFLNHISVFNINSIHLLDKTVSVFLSHTPHTFSYTMKIYKKKASQLASYISRTLLTNSVTIVFPHGWVLKWYRRSSSSYKEACLITQHPLSSFSSKYVFSQTCVEDRICRPTHNNNKPCIHPGKHTGSSNCWYLYTNIKSDPKYSVICRINRRLFSPQ